MIVLLHGSNHLAIEERVRELVHERDPSGISTTVVEHAGRHLDALQRACASVGFFDSARVVVAHGLLEEQPAARRGKHPSDSPSAMDSVLRNLPASTTLVLVEQMADRETERRLRRLSPDVVVERCDAPRDRDLLQWTTERARRYGATLDGTAAEALLEALFPGVQRQPRGRDEIEPNLYRLDSEIAKLAAAAGGGRITRALVSQLVPGADAPNLWGTTNAIAHGDPPGALREVIRALEDGSAPEILLGQLAGQFEALALLGALPAGARPAEAARVTGLNESRVRNLQPLLPRFDPARVASALDALRALDARAKSGLVEPGVGLIAVVAQIANA